MASSAFCLCRATTLLIPYIFLATLAHPASLSSGTKPTRTFCFGRRSRTSSPAVTAGEVERFLGAVSDGAHSSLHRSYNASLHIDAQNRTMYAVAQCRPDVPASDCAACLAASSWFLATGAASCADAAVWHEHDRCFFRYSDRDTSRFREDELAATVFNSSGRPARHGRAAVMDRLDRSMQRRRLLGTSPPPLYQDPPVSYTFDASHKHSGSVVPSPPPLYQDPPVSYTFNASHKHSGSVVPSPPPLYQDPPVSYTFDASHKHSGSVVPSPPPLYQDPPVSYTFDASHKHSGSVAPSPSPLCQDPPVSYTFDASIPSPAFSNKTNMTIDTRPHSAAPPEAQPQTTSHRRINKTLILLIVLIGTGVAVGSILLIFCLHRRRRQNRREVVDGMPGEDVYIQGEEHLNAGDDDEDEKSTSCQPYSYESLEVATQHFSNSNKLGSGGYGTVYKGTIENGEVAVKRLNDSKRSLAELVREVFIVAKLCHENLVRFLGYCFEDKGRLLVYECLPNNSLDKYYWNKSN